MAAWVGSWNAWTHLQTSIQLVREDRKGGARGLLAQLHSSAKAGRGKSLVAFVFLSQCLHIC
jgi:hypothetical protein